jgi:hypothetical protein
MTTPHPSALTDYQFAVLRTAARKMPHDFRSRFLALVAAELVGLDIVSDCHVHAATSTVLSRMLRLP